MAGPRVAASVPMEAALTRPAEAAAAPQAAHEIATLFDLARSPGRDLADDGMAREVLRWFRRFDTDAERVLADLDAIDAKEPKPSLLQVYAATNGPWYVSGNGQSVTSGSQDVFVLARGEVGRDVREERCLEPRKTA